MELEFSLLGENMMDKWSDKFRRNIYESKGLMYPLLYKILMFVYDPLSIQPRLSSVWVSARPDFPSVSLVSNVLEVSVFPYSRVRFNSSYF